MTPSKLNTEYYQYLTHTNNDEAWGLFLSVIGFTHVAPNSNYPPTGHPAGYTFNWQHGRILREHQLIYITNGRGWLEINSYRYQILPGTVLFLQPGIWHRYRPEKKTGWNEHYIGLQGKFTSDILSDIFVPADKPLLYIGFQDEIIKQFLEIIDTVHEEKPGFQQVCSGIAMHLIANILSISKNKEFSNQEIERKIRRACIFLRENLTKTVNVEELADQIHLGYSHFRRLFKKYTGQSPAQYHLNLRLQKACDMLSSTNMSIKQIAFSLGFQSNYYFTRIFTRKMGKTPTEFRKQG